MVIEDAKTVDSNGDGDVDGRDFDFLALLLSIAASMLRFTLRWVNSSTNRFIRSASCAEFHFLIAIRASSRKLPILSLKDE